MNFISNNLLFFLAGVSNKSFIFYLIGSPFSVNVGGQGSSRLKESIMRERRAVDITHIGSQCELSLKIPGMYSLYPIYFLFFSFAIWFTNNICRRKKKLNA
jgi:hypothetical protein